MRIKNKKNVLNMAYYLYGYFNLEKSFDNFNLSAGDYYSTGKVTISLSRAPCHTPVQMNDFRIDENDDYK